MTDFGEGSEKTVVERTTEIHSFFGRDGMALAEELGATKTASRLCHTQTEIEEVPESLWFRPVDIEHDPSYSKTDLPLPKLRPVTVQPSNRASATGSLPITLESSSKNQPSPAPEMEASKLQRVEARTSTRARSKMARSLMSRALLWEYLGLVTAAACSIFLFEFTQSNGAISGAMLFPLFLLSGTATWVVLGLLGRYTWLSPLFSSLGLWVLLTLGWQVFAAMHGGYALLLTARSMLPTGGLRPVSH